MAFKRKSTDVDGKPVAKKPVKKAAAKTEEDIHVVEKEEIWDDNTLLCKFDIPGRPATKKTHQQIVYVKGHPRVIPSSQYAAYEKVCKPFCEDAWKNKNQKPMDFGISIKVKIFLNTWAVGDHVGYLQAIGDILEKHGVIANDAWIHWTDAGEHWFGGVDKDNPRVEIEIRRYRHPREEYRGDKETALRAKLERQKIAANKLLSNDYR